MMIVANLGSSPPFLGAGLTCRGSLFLGASSNMIKSGSFSATSFMVLTMEGIGFLALRRHRGKFGGSQPPLAFDREPRA